MNSPHSFCPECGSEAEPGSSFCGDCGQSLLTSGDPEVVSADVHQQNQHSADIVEPPIAETAPRKRRGVLIAAVVLLLIAAAFGIFLASRGSTHTSASAVHPKDTDASAPSSDSGQVSTCESLLPVADVTGLTGATTIVVSSFSQSWPRFPAPPTANCHYIADAAQNGGVPDLGKSVVLWLWLQQPDSPQLYKSLASGYPYGDTSAIKPFSGLGQRAVTDFSSVIVQASAVDTFEVSVGGASDWLKSIYLARQIARELTGGGTTSGTTGSTGQGTSSESASAQPGSSGSVSPSGSTASPTTPSASGNSGSGSTAPSTTTTPPPTTTTSTFSGADQAFLNDVVAQIPGIESSNTQNEMVSGAQAVCALAPSVANSFEPWTYLVAAANNTLNIPDGPQNEGPSTFTAIAITDLCPAYSDLIPAGTPT